MFGRIKDMVKRAALNKVREKMINPQLAGIGTVEELSIRDKGVYLVVKLAGLEDRPIDVKCSDINIAEDGSSVTIGHCESEMPFVREAMARFLQNRKIDLPEGNARKSALTIKKLFNI